MDELEGQEAAREALIAAWPHMDAPGRRRLLRAWLREEIPSAEDPRDIQRGPALDAFIGARR